MIEQELLIVLELDPDTDAEDAERLGRQLRARLLDLDIEAVRPVSGPEPPGTAKGAAVDWTQLLLTLSATGGVFTSVVTLAREWLKGHSAARRLKITIGNDTLELEQATTVEREQLISDWMRRHEGT